MSRYGTPNTAYGGGVRYGYRHDVVVPTSREGVIIFPTNKTTGRMDYSMYQQVMTQNLISNEEVASFLQGVDAFVQPVFKSDFLDLMKIGPWIFMVAMIVLIIFMLGSTMGFIRTSLPFYQIPMLVSVIIVILAIFLSVANCVVVAHVKRKIKEAKEKVQAYILQYNSAFQARGYFWVAPANFPYWIELWTANTNQGMSAGMVVNTQPMGGFNMQQQYMMLPQQQTPSYIGNYGAGSQFNSPLQQQSFSPV